MGKSGFTLNTVLFLLTVFGMLYIAQRFWFRAAWGAARRIRSPFWNAASRILTVAAVLAILLAALDRSALHFLPQQGPANWLVIAVDLWLLPSFFAFLLVMVVRVVERLWNAIRRPARSDAGTEPDPARRAFFRYAAGLLATAPLAAAVYGFARDRLDFTIRRVDIPVANLPPALDGMTIAQLSDIHIGDFMPVDQVHRAVDMANALGADLAVVTGDFVTDSHDPLEACISELSRLRAPLGVWGCNGNHEIYANAEEKAQELFQRHGMRLLRQESTVVTWRGAAFNLIGVDYQRQRRWDGSPAVMLEGIESHVRRDLPNILLSHNPNSFYRAAEAGIELSLAGHTHGGQVKVEIVDHSFSPAQFMTRFIAGPYSLPMTNGGTSRLYVNRGLGTIGIPARLGVDPEITLLTLRRG